LREQQELDKPMRLRASKEKKESTRFALDQRKRTIQKLGMGLARTIEILNPLLRRYFNQNGVAWVPGL
jgi:hypothetical protein